VKTRAVVKAIDSLDVVNLMSWRYADVARQLSDRLGIRPFRTTRRLIFMRVKDIDERSARDELEAAQETENPN
jgi:putative hemolysin